MLKKLYFLITSFVTGLGSIFTCSDDKCENPNRIVEKRKEKNKHGTKNYGKKKQIGNNKEVTVKEVTTKKIKWKEGEQ